ncbi:MAG: hypothetical protein M3Q10_09480 [Chloroflexota bacterium]|nr:hypothetical protein [Chloroflexota bacterium]
MSVDNPLRTAVAGPGDPDDLDPADDHLAAGAGALPLPGQAAPLAGRRLPFAARFQAILIGVMFVGFALIAQGWSKALYQIGLPLLVLAAFLQVAFGNIPPSANLARSLRLLAITWVIVAAVFGLGILLAPYLIGLGR